MKSEKEVKSEKICVRFLKIFVFKTRHVFFKTRHDFFKTRHDFPITRRFTFHFSLFTYHFYWVRRVSAISFVRARARETEKRDSD